MTVQIINPSIMTHDVVDMPRNSGTYVAVDTSVLSNSGREALLQDVGVSVADVAKVVRVGWYPKASANGGFGETNVSFKMESVVRYTDAEGIEVDRPIRGVIAWTVPGKTGVVVSPEATYAFLCELFSMIAHVDASGAIQFDTLTSLQYGVLTGAATNSDEPAA